ncbi:hypothetical protein HID58_043896 [Brassica napus]|uniref:Ubiquitin-like protease family profile domain-containing protein n=1 Tax=Brassica napus TaxID=3708 RepID=A0ABQ8BI14_BRANA|nr:hypothetical protein HID58_043896 [Brassica napus]
MVFYKVSEASQSSLDVNFSQADDIIPRIGMQGVEGLSQTSYVPDFDPSQTNKGDEWWTSRTSVRDSLAPLPSHWEKWNKGKGVQLTDSPLRTDGSPQSIVKAVALPERQKQLLLASYSIVDVPMKMRLNKSCCDCGAYALKHLECHLLGIDLSLLDDEIIMGCRQKIGVDLWQAAHDLIYAEAMTRYVPSPWEREEVFDLED